MTHLRDNGLLLYSCDPRLVAITIALSHLAAVVATRVALHIVSREAMGLKSRLLGSVLMGSGIGTMHYAGMR